MSRLILPAVLVFVGLVSPLPAARVKVWHQHTPAHYEKAHLDHAVVSSDGVLRLARQLKPLANLEATHVWALIEDDQGNLIAATGDEGKIYKITADGQTSVLHTCSASQVLCLARGKDGAIYAGTGPGGQILRLVNGKARVWCETHQTYVWSLAVAADGHVYAGTGPKGRIYKINPEGKSQLFYQTRQEHILCLAMELETLYAGTDKGGLVYKIDARGKGFVLHQAAQAEVRSLTPTADGLYVGTSAVGRGRVGSGRAASSSVDGSSTEAVGESQPADEKTDQSASKVKPPKGDSPGRQRRQGQARKSTPASEKSSDSSSSAKEKESSAKGASAPAPSTPGSGENSVYRISADGIGARVVPRESPGPVPAAPGRRKRRRIRWRGPIPGRHRHGGAAVRGGRDDSRTH